LPFNFCYSHRGGNPSRMQQRSLSQLQNDAQSLLWFNFAADRFPFVLARREQFLRR
jgi:hypothetical protein